MPVAALWRLERGVEEVPRQHFSPGFDGEVFVLRRHLRHLNSQTRQHPRAFDGHQVFHAEATVGGMEVGGIFAP